MPTSKKKKRGKDAKGSREGEDATTEPIAVSGAAGVATGLGSDTFTDEVGRLFCAAHRRAVCHECCLDFRLVNEHTEAHKGLRKAPSRAETLATDRENVLAGIKYLRQQDAATLASREAEFPEFGLKFHEEKLKEVEAELRELKSSGEDTDDAVAKASEKHTSQDAERDAVVAAWAKEHPGQTSMEFGGADTQRLFDQFAAAPPSASSVAPDVRTCDYCKKASDVKLDLCGRCRKVAFCGKECQRAAWKAHRLVCTPTDEWTKRKQLELTWAQVEAHGGAPVSGKTLEVRAIVDQSVTRQVFLCKDRVGASKRVAAYTQSRAIPGLAPGCVLRWKNPRFHTFIDGSSGARIEDADLENITISRLTGT